MKEIKIENITLSLLSEGANVRVKSNKENFILSSQNVDSVAELIQYNFYVVANHYKLMIDREKKEFDVKDINSISMSIVLHYLYMYNSWRGMYKKQKHKDLTFNEKDFNNPSTYDIMFNYFKRKQPNDWEEKCAVLSGMGLSKLKAYYKTRENFYNR